jgi:hypothetical protein
MSGQRVLISVYDILQKPDKFALYELFVSGRFEIPLQVDPTGTYEYSITCTIDDDSLIILCSFDHNSDRYPKS